MVRRYRQESANPAGGPQFGEEEGVGYKDGVPPYLQPHEPLSAEQIALNQIEIDKIRAALKRPKDSQG